MSPPNRIHILFKCTWNILQDRPHARPQTSPNKFKGKIISSIFADHNSMRLEINYKRDFPGGPVAKTPCSQCRGLGFHPWSGN